MVMGWIVVVIMFAMVCDSKDDDGCQGEEESHKEAPA